jgi:hypothetical protein
MPAPQLHLTFGNLVCQNDRVPARLRHACAAEPVYVRLGAIFHDLPYYRPELGNMAVEAVRYWLEQPALDEPWAYRMHSVRPDAFVASYIRAAASTLGLTDEERLALVGGLISHCALDLALHPLVNYCARRDTTRHGGHESVHHRLTEKYHALFFHLDKLGEDPIGRHDFYKQTQVVKQGSWLRATVEKPIGELMQSAYRGAYGDAPDVATWAGWVRSFRHFGAMVSTPFAAKNSAKKRQDPSLRDRYFENDRFRFYEFYPVAEERLGELAQLALDYFDGKISEAEFRSAARIDDLAEPNPQLQGLPPLETLTVRCTPGVTAPPGHPPWRKSERKRERKKLDRQLESAA